MKGSPTQCGGRPGWHGHFQSGPSEHVARGCSDRCLVVAFSDNRRFPTIILAVQVDGFAAQSDRVATDIPQRAVVSEPDAVSSVVALSGQMWLLFEPIRLRPLHKELRMLPDLQ